MGSDENHFNVSVGSDGQSHRTVSTNHNLFEEKGEPKPRYRTAGGAASVAVPALSQVVCIAGRHACLSISVTLSDILVVVVVVFPTD